MRGEVDRHFMRRCLQLAKRAEGKTAPNPLVGAVIVKKGKVISEGYHKEAGSLHAEVLAIENARENLKGATLYVNLEPCSTYGRTPPCVDRIVEAGIEEVVFATLDPNPLHCGKGIDKLRKRGIKVKGGILEEEARRLNRVFFKHIVKKIPYVSLKVAQSLDGRIADLRGDSKWISSQSARRYVHTKIRPRVDAILVGINSVLRDDPALTARRSESNFYKKQPLRVVLDSKLRIPLNAQLVKDKRSSTLIVADKRLKKEKKIKRLENQGVRILKLPSRNGRIELLPLLEHLYQLGISHLLVEGGSEVIGSFLEEKLVDEIYLFISGKILGGPYLSYKGESFRIGLTPRLKWMEVKRFEQTVLIRGELEYV